MKIGLVNNWLCPPDSWNLSLAQWISKLPGSFQIHRVRQHLVDVVIFGINDLRTSEMTAKLKSNLYVGPVNIFPIYFTLQPWQIWLHPMNLFGTPYHDGVIKWKHFRATGHLWGEFTGDREFPAQMPVTRSFDVFFDLHLNKRLSKQSWGWWFETPSRSLWRHRNVDSQQIKPNKTGYIFVGHTE